MSRTHLQLPADLARSPNTQIYFHILNLSPMPSPPASRDVFGKINLSLIFARCPSRSPTHFAEIKPSVNFVREEKWRVACYSALQSTFLLYLLKAWLFKTRTPEINLLEFNSRRSDTAQGHHSLYIHWRGRGLGGLIKYSGENRDPSEIKRCSYSQTEYRSCVLVRQGRRPVPTAAWGHTFLAIAGRRFSVSPPRSSGLISLLLCQEWLDSVPNLTDLFDHP